jgi:hypothetical protein
MWEYDTLDGMESDNRAAREDDGMKQISLGFHELVEPDTFSKSVWIQVD